MRSCAVKFGAERATRSKGQATKKGTAAAFSVFYLLSNVILAHAYETNVWTERRAKSAVQVASLPASTGILPSLQRTNLLSSPERLPLSPSSVSDSFQAFVKARLSVYGNVREIHVPPTAKRVVLYV